MLELGSVAVLALIVNIIVELTKDIGVINKIPTQLYAIVISLFVNFISLGALGTLVTIQVVCITILSSFIVAYMSMYSYDTLIGLYDRFKFKGSEK